MSALLACGFLVSCFSVDAFAADNADDSGQLALSLSGGQISTYWSSKYNGESVSYGNFTADYDHRITYTEVRYGNSTYNKSREPVLNSSTLTFDSTFPLIAGRRYYIAFQALPVRFTGSMSVQLSFFDQYNTCSWTSDDFTVGSQYGGNGFTYVLLDCPITFEVKTIRVRVFNSPAWYDGTFDVGYNPQPWLNVVRLAKDDDRSVDEIVKAIQDQTAADQNRYDDFTSNGSEQGSSAIDSTKNSVSEKIGILDFAEGVLSDFIGLFSANPGDATLTLPGFKWHDSDTNTDLTVWESQTFDFAFVEEHFGPLVSALRVGTVLSVYGALLWYLQAVFDRIFGGGD